VPRELRRGPCPGPEPEALVGDFPVPQQRWKNALGTLQVLWVGVHCDAAIAAGRELARGDRIAGMAASQAELVHRGVVYDLQVDTTHTEALQCAQAVAARVH
jgi:chloramphenicol 3-O phosphotransferase